jgi:hypothetical protein
MFGDHFYHATVRKAVAVFGTLFNDLEVIRKDGSGGLINQVKVPLAYGPKEKYLARSDQSGSEAVAIKMPRMSFEITGLEQDLTQQLAKRNVVKETGADLLRVKTIRHNTAYNINMSLSILSKTQDDGLQILEQIIPYFQPEYTVSIRPIEGFELSQDVPIILQSVSLAHEYEGNVGDASVLIYTLEFSMKMNFYGPTGKQGIIREINIDFSNHKGTGDVLEEMDFTIVPDDANRDDDYSVTVVIK